MSNPYCPLVIGGVSGPESTAAVTVVSPTRAARNGLDPMYSAGTEQG